MSLVFAEPDPTIARLSGFLNVFMRCVAVGWLAAGLLEWARLIGLIPLAGTLFTDASSALQVLTVVFALLNLLVAVGLWLLAAWGIVVWGASIALQAASGAVTGGSGAFAEGITALNAATLLAYAGVLLVIMRRRRVGRD